MIYKDFFFSIAVAVLLCIVFILLLRRKGPRKGHAWLLLTIFLTAWAGGTWGNFFRPVVPEIQWLPHLLAGLLAAIVIWIFLPKGPKIDDQAQLDRQETLAMLEQIKKTREMEKLAYVTIDIFVLCILMLLIAAIVYRYLEHG